MKIMYKKEIILIKAPTKSFDYVNYYINLYYIKKIKKIPN